MRKSRAVDIGARIKTAGAYVDVSQENNESGGQAVRTLIQFSALQMLGDLAHVPYQSCLHLDKAPTYEALAQEVTAPPAPKLDVLIKTSRGASDPVYHPNELLNFSLSVNQAAEVHCFIGDSANHIRPIFPNLAQPNARLSANQSVQISSATANFGYRFDKTGFEQLICLASTGTLQTPWGFNKDVEHAAYLPVADFQDVESGYRQNSTGDVSLKKLTIYIEP
jgi:hypothetical protein